MDMLTLSHVSKSFGKKQVLKDLSFSVPEGSIYGFIGKNGAGKTTTMKLILGLLSPDQGTIRVNGQKVSFGQNRTNAYIGYLPDVPEFYGYMTPREYLRLCGRITKMEEPQIRKRSRELLRLVGLEEEDRRIRNFSRGMKQRLGIAQALLNSPRLLICDEPTSALDPLGRKEILDILVSVKEQTTVLFSSHILSDVERICDNAALLHNGSLALQGTLEELRALSKPQGFDLEFLRPRDCLRFLRSFPVFQPLTSSHLFHPRGTDQDMRLAMDFLAKNEIPVQRLEKREPDLENLFMEVIRQ